MYDEATISRVAFELEKRLKFSANRPQDYKVNEVK